MKLQILAIVALLSPFCLTTAAKAQARPSAEQVLNACLQDRADTLPIPFTDVSPNDWAFKAVMNLYYCGPIGPNTPPTVIERLRNNIDRRSSETRSDLPSRAFSGEINRESF